MEAIRQPLRAVRPLAFGKFHAPGGGAPHPWATEADEWNVRTGFGLKWD